MRRLVWLICLTLVGLLCQPIGAAAQEGQKVAVAPFIMSAEGAQLEQLSRLSKSLVGVVVQGFSSQNFVPLSMGDNVLATGEEAAKAQARDLGADYIFLTTVNKAGERFNMTGQLVALNAGGRSSDRVTVTSNAMENLPQTAERLVLMTTDHLFGGGVKVVSVDIAGSSIVGKQAILNTLRIRPGGTYNDAKATSDIKRIYAMGYFEDVQVEARDVSGGKAVSFVVKERSQLGGIAFRGNKKFDHDDLMKVIGVKEYGVPSERDIANSIENIKRLYTDKGYPQVQVTTTFDAGENGKSVLVYNVEEGGKIYIDKVLFDGNENYSSWRLRKQIDTNSKGLLSWLSGSGKLNQEKLSGDAQKLEAFYLNNGYIQARVGDPIITSNEDGGLIITFPIVEGERFRVGEVTLSGELLPDDEPKKLMKQVHVKGEKWLGREMVQNDVKRLQTYYSDLGYAHNQVEPRLGQPGEDNKVDIDFAISPKNQVHFDRITIVGNAKTRDKVIRRQLAVAEGDLFSSSKVQASQANLMRSSYFDQVNLVPGPSDSDEKMNLRVEVKERPTGSFQIGGGYSNYNSVFGVARVTQDNLFGYGRRLSMEANVGSKNNYFDFSYTDPWVADIPLTLGMDIFKYQTKYDYYKKDSVGAAIKAGYPLGGKFYLTARYSWENIDITDVGLNSSKYLKSMMDFSVDSVWTFSLRRDTRNHFFYPTQGTNTRLAYAIGSGFLNGDTSFSRYEGEGAFWVPVPFIKGAAFMAHGEFGYIEENKTDGLPTYEKYMIGGINSVRGYDWYSISPRDPQTWETIGGEKMMVLNFELTMPILKDEGLYAVAFFDMGNVWAKGHDYKVDDLRKSYGGGLRYLSPMGPFRIEYGIPLDKEAGDSSGQWEFTMGSMF